MKTPSLIFYVVLIILLDCCDVLIWSVGVGLVAAGIAYLVRIGTMEYVKKKENIPAQTGIFVTGTSSGIGRMFALSLAANGIHVFAGVRKEEDGISLQTEFKERNPDLTKDFIIPVIIDVANPTHISEAVTFISDHLTEKCLSLQAVVMNAGIQSLGPLEFKSMEDIKYAFEVNTFGSLAVAKAFIPTLRKSKGEGTQIIFVSSVAGSVSLPLMSTYSATKYALEAFADGLRVELRGSSAISVHVIEPGTFKSKIIKDDFEQGVYDFSQLSKEQGISEEVLKNQFDERYGKAWVRNCKLTHKALKMAKEPHPVYRELHYMLFAPRWLKPIRRIIGMELFAITLFRDLLPQIVVDYLLWVVYFK
eukprot:TRINITY_DN5821_c0_g1_i2.p1 TRINITY_DN5821_c0_g1~~TRINITY_DN5821_c0_g1_i2.p1  ORF type:complete len:363 (+),score=44.00 TRINITY_DN5821_c0_g1_i2:127-1215(+)